jgi:hypothetical protein
MYLEHNLYILEPEAMLLILLSLVAVMFSILCALYVTIKYIIKFYIQSATLGLRKSEMLEFEDYKILELKKKKILETRDSEIYTLPLIILVYLVYLYILFRYSNILEKDALAIEALRKFKFINHVMQKD